MSEILGNICDRSIAIVLEIVETYFLRKMFQNLMFMFYFYPKSSRTSSRKTSLTEGMLVVESCPTPR